MRLLFVLICIVLNQHVISQDWEDYLDDARQLYNEKKYEKALENYKKAESLAPKSEDFSKEIAQTSYKIKDYKNSSTYYSKASQKTNSQKEKAKLQHNAGNSYYQQKNYQDAVNCYKNSLKYDPNNPTTRSNYLAALKKLKEQQKNKQQEQNQQNQNQQNQKPQENKSNEEEQKNKSKLNKNTTERLLDELMKKEMETKRKMKGKPSSNSENNSGKDW